MAARADQCISKDCSVTGSGSGQGRVRPVWTLGGGGTWLWNRAALPDILMGRGKALEEPVEPEIWPWPFLENSTVTVCPLGLVEVYFNVLTH